MRQIHDPARHTDETRVIEDHRQTAQKLAMYRGYVGPWGNILVQARNLPFRVKHLFFIDTHCGAGQHGSREHPDQRVFGSPLIACHEARRLQRRYPGVQVHVRAVDSDPRWIAHLRQRVQGFITASDVPDRVDVQAFAEPFEKVLPALLAEAQEYNAPSLWFIDPYGIKLPYDVLTVLQRPKYGPEVIINLDMLGIWRVDAAARDRVDHRFEEVIFGDYAAQQCLNELFGGRQYWEKVADRSRSMRDNVPSLAAAYAERFGRFEYRRHHPLHASHGQVRQIIHLCHSRVGASRFYEVYVQSQDFGLLSGRHLDYVTRAHAARRYWESYRGEATPVDRLYQEGTQPYDRSQIRPICVTAEEERYGRFNEREAMMLWFDDRAPDPADSAYQTALFN